MFAGNSSQNYSNGQTMQSVNAEEPSFWKMFFHTLLWTIVVAAATIALDVLRRKAQREIGDGISHYIVGRVAGGSISGDNPFSGRRESPTPMYGNNNNNPFASSSSSSSQQTSLFRSQPSSSWSNNPFA